MRKRIGTRSFDTERSSLVACSAESVEEMKAELYRSNNGTLFFCHETPAGRDLTVANFQEAKEWLERSGRPTSLLGKGPEDDALQRCEHSFGKHSLFDRNICSLVLESFT